MEGKLNERDHKILKGISKFLQIITIIGKVCMYIAIPCVILAMCIAPVVIKNIEAYETSIKFEYKDNKLVVEKEENGKIVAKYNDKEVDKNDQTALQNIYEHKNIFIDYSNAQLIGYTEAFLLIGTTCLFITLFLLRHFSKLFKNIYEDDTPFTTENVEHLSVIGKLMIALVIIPMLGTVLFELIADIDISWNFGLFSITEILFIILLSKIFKYGYELENNKK